MKKISVYSILILCLMIFVGVLLYDQQKTLDRNVQKYQQLQAEINQAQEKLAELEDQMDKVGTDEYIEDKAREELGYIKENETVFYEE